MNELARDWMNELARDLNERTHLCNASNDTRSDDQLVWYKIYIFEMMYFNLKSSRRNWYDRSIYTSHT